MVAVYTIAKNEAAHIERWAESCEDADVRLVLDTGSSDNTGDIARAAGCDVHAVEVTPWRFDHARNLSLNMLPRGIDWCIALDADEVLAPGWRDHIEALTPDVTRPRYRYVWSWNPDGTEGLVYGGDKIHRRHGYRWRLPVHETLAPDGIEVEAWCGLEIHHHPDPAKPRSQYLPLLELAAQEDPEDCRTAFYLGREYVYAGRYAEARRELWRYLHMPAATWPPERAAAWRLLAQIDDMPERWLLRACAEDTGRRESWVALAEHHLRAGDRIQAIAAATRALSITTKPLDYLCEPWAWGERPHQLISEASMEAAA